MFHEKHHTRLYGQRHHIAEKTLRTVTGAFSESGFSVYIAGAGLPEQSFSPAGKAVFHTAPRFDFGRLLPRSALFINHGGQNSVVDGFIYGVPQLICPGSVFERKFNASGVVKNGAGAELSPEGFVPEAVRQTAERLISDGSYRVRAAGLGERLLSLGGTDNILSALSAHDILSR